MTDTQNIPITFTVNIINIRTATYSTELTDVIKLVTYSVTATKQSVSFTTPEYEAELGDPIDEFIPYSYVTQSDLVRWLENDITTSATIYNLKFSAEFNLEKLIKQNSFTPKPLPWS